MIRHGFWFLLPTIIILTGCPVPHTPEVPPGGQARIIDPDTGAGYFLYVPSKYRHDKPVPVIISCHGTPPYDVSEHHIRTWKWYGEHYGCIIICPDMEGTDGIFGDGPIGGMLINERRIMSILSCLSYKYNLDRANIMITGFSGGGFPAYWVGLRHPDVFTVVVAQNCNFSRSNLDGWYPTNAVKTPVMVYYGENDPGTIVAQSKNAIAYLRGRGFNVKTAIIPGAGHDRHPEIAMNFFRKNWKKSISTFADSGKTRTIGSTARRRQSYDKDTETPSTNLRGPRPPAP